MCIGAASFANIDDMDKGEPWPNVGTKLLEFYNWIKFGISSSKDLSFITMKAIKSNFCVILIIIIFFCLQIVDQMNQILQGFKKWKINNEIIRHKK